MTWKERLADARHRQVVRSTQLSREEVAHLRDAVETLDVSSPENMAFLWSGRAIPTGVKLDEHADSGSWWDKLSYGEAEVFRKLRIGFSVEDTPGGQFLVQAALNYPEDDPLSAVARELWDVLSARFVQAAHGRIEIVSEGSFDDSVFRKVEFNALLGNDGITAVNGLERSLLGSNAGEAYSLLRRWDVERSRRYSEFIASATDATPHERAVALDDFREIQLWYEQDFFELLGPGREMPALPAAAGAVDRCKDVRGWKYSTAWRGFIQAAGGHQAGESRGVNE